MLLCLFRIDKMSELFGQNVLSWDKSEIRILNTTNILHQFDSENISINFENNLIKENGRINCIETYGNKLFAYCYKNYIKFLRFHNKTYFKNETKLDGHISSLKYINDSCFVLAYFSGNVELWKNLNHVRIIKKLSFTIDGINLEILENLLGFSRKKNIHVWNLKENITIARLNHSSSVNNFLILKSKILILFKFILVTFKFFKDKIIQYQFQILTKIQN